MKKSLADIVKMKNEELSEYYHSRQLLNEGMDDMPEQIEMPLDEFVKRYNLVSDSEAQRIIDSIIERHGTHSIKNSK